MSVPKIKFVTLGLEVIFKKDAKVIKMTLFHHKMHHIKAMLLNPKRFCE